MALEIKVQALDRHKMWRVRPVNEYWFGIIFQTFALPEHLRSPPRFSGILVTRSLVLCVCFVDVFCPFVLFLFGHCVVCSSSIYGFRLPLWYLQTLLLAGLQISRKTRRFYRKWRRCIKWWNNVKVHYMYIRITKD